MRITFSGIKGEGSFFFRESLQPYLGSFSSGISASIPASPANRCRWQNILFYIGTLILGISYPIWAFWLGSLLFSSTFGIGIGLQSILGTCNDLAGKMMARYHAWMHPHL